MRFAPCITTVALAVIALLGGVHPLHGQQPAPDPEMAAADSVVRVCAAAAAARRPSDALAAADVAERAYRARILRRPGEVRALVGLARTIGACRIPSADLALAGDLSAESIELLQRALDIQPNHWAARYMLALNYYRSPPFMNRSADAARELDRLIALQGDRNDVTEFARTYEYRGMLWSRAARPDSARAVWERGLRLFPGDAVLRERLRLPAVAAAPAPAQPPSQTDTARAAASPPVDSVRAATPVRPDTARTVSSPSVPVIAPSTGTLEAVRVIASRAAIASASATPSERALTRSEVLTTAGGTADILQAAQLQPGATRVSEGADVYARGGDPAETPMFVDGGRTLPVSRFEGLSGGLFGVIDPYVVKSVRFSTGGFSVRRGNALSGVLDIETDSRPRDTQWRVGGSLTQGAATGRLPFGATSGGWGTVRATHAGALLRTHGRMGEFDGSPQSVDVMAGYIAQPKPGQELRAVVVAMRDASAKIVDANGYRGAFDSEGSSEALILSSQHLASGGVPIVVRTNLSLSQRTTDWTFGVLERDRRERSAVARADVEYAPSDAVMLRTGLEIARLGRRDNGSLPTTATVAPGSPVRQLDEATSGTGSVGGYGEGEWSIGHMTVLGGIRADRLPGEDDVTFDPRLAISARAGAWTSRVSGGLFHQGRWRPEASIPDRGTPGGLPREARHLVLGVQREGPISLQVEAFVKDYDDYGAFGSGPQIIDGRARGVDLIAQRSVGARVNGWVGYSFLDADLELVDGSTARSPYDITHTATGTVTLRLARGTSLGTTARYGTGRPFTPIVGATETNRGVVPMYGAPTSERLPDYGRVDVRLMQYLPLSKSLLVGYVEVLNVLDRENVAGYVWDAGYQSRRATNTFYAQRTIVFGFELQSR